jgi:hypothetical protein
VAGLVAPDGTTKLTEASESCGTADAVYFQSNVVLKVPQSFVGEGTELTIFPTAGKTHRIQPVL